MKKFQWITNVHVYSLPLVVGDAHHIINQLKVGDAYFNYFYNDDNENFINEIDKIKEKDVECFTLNFGGGRWFPIFDLLRDKKKYEIEGYFIDCASSKLVPYFQRPECFFSDEHIEIINKNIEISLKKKPLFNLTTKSKKILFMETDDQVKFNTKEEINIDYSLSAEKIFNDLYDIYNSDKIKFINFDHSADNMTFDFHIDRLSSTKYEVYKIDSFKKDIDWFASYYAKFHTDEKDIYNRKKTPKEVIKKTQKWMEQFTKPLGIDLDKVKETYDPDAPSIEKYKSFVEDYGFFHGYYLKAID